MNYYDLLKKKVLKRRLIPGVIAIIVGILLIVPCIGEVANYLEGPVEISAQNIEERQLERFDGKYVKVNIEDITLQIGEGEKDGHMYGFIPCRKSGWLAGYEGGIQYNIVLVANSECDEFKKMFEKLLYNDSHGAGKALDLNYEIIGKVRKRTGIWQSYMEEYANYLIEKKDIESMDDINNAYSEYVIDATYSKPLGQMLCICLGMIISMWGIWIIAGIFTKPDKRAIDKFMAYSRRKYNKSMIYKDYNKGDVFGNVVIGEKFIYYVKKMRNKILVTNNIANVCIKKRLMHDKIILTDMDGKKYSFSCKKKYGEDIVKMLI